MTVATVDTTVLVKSVLDRVSIELEDYAAIEIPHYAIKELSLGPLKHWVYVHNLVSSVGLGSALVRISRLYRKPNMQNTALAAVAHAVANTASRSDDELSRYLRRRILCTRRQVEKLGTVVGQLPCFDETEPQKTPSKQIKFSHVRYGCVDDDSCAMQVYLQQNRKRLKKLLNANMKLRADADKREFKVRCQALRAAAARNTRLSPKECRNLGDAAIDHFVHARGILLTTNLRDHRKPCRRLGAEAISPFDD